MKYIDPTDSLNGFAQHKLAAIAGRDLTRKTRPTTRSNAMTAEREGQTLISFTDNDYLGLSQHPLVKTAAAEAALQYGAGAGASRLVTGDCPLYGEAEARIARLKSTEAACVFPTGYMANIGIIPTLVGRHDLIIADELVHTSIRAGIQLSGATVHYCRHNDVADAETLLRSHRGHHPRALMLVDGVYSMDGDIAPLAALGTLCKDHDTWLMADDAHGFGVLADGRGTAHHCGAEALVPLQMGTLSKGIGALGGYLAGSRKVVDLMINRARPMIYTTGLPPAVLAAASKALQLIEENPDMCARPVTLARRFCARTGLQRPDTPIVPLVLGSAAATLAASKALADAGFLVTAIRPPTVPEGTSRLRISFSASHRDSDVDRLAATLQQLGLTGQAA